MDEDTDGAECEGGEWPGGLGVACQEYIDLDLVSVYSVSVLR